MIRHGRAPSRLATSIWPRSTSEKAASRGLQHERRIDRHLGEDHAPGGIEEIDRRIGEMERLHQRAVEHAGRAVEEGEGERHQKGRQGDERVDQAGDEGRAGERDEGDDQRQRQAEGEAAGGRGERDLDGVERAR